MVFARSSYLYRSASLVARQLAPQKRLLSTFDKHKTIFDQLGISKTGNTGVFHGEWKASGPVMPSVNPVNNEVIAEVVAGSTADLNTAFDRVAEAQKIWREVRQEVQDEGHALIV